MTVTEEWLRDNMNGGVGANAQQLESLGIKWPPKKGWLRRLVGTEITEEQKAAFEKLKNATKKPVVFAESVQRDGYEVFMYASRLPKYDFMRTPIFSFGAARCPNEKCALCGTKIALTKKSHSAFKTVALCTECNEKLGETI